jgi:hypothetical protein
MDLIELRLAVATPLQLDEESALTTWIQTKFAYPFRVAFVYLDAIPSTEAGKFADFVSEVGACPTIDKRAGSAGETVRG